MGTVYLNLQDLILQAEDAAYPTTQTLDSNPAQAIQPLQATRPPVQPEPDERVLLSEKGDHHPANEDDATLWASIRMSSAYCHYCKKAYTPGHETNQFHQQRYNSLKEFRERYRREIHPLRNQVVAWLVKLRNNATPLSDSLLQDVSALDGKLNAIIVFLFSILSYCFTNFPVK